MWFQENDNILFQVLININHDLQNKTNTEGTMKLMT